MEVFQVIPGVSITANKKPTPTTKMSKVNPVEKFSKEVNTAVNAQWASLQEAEDEMLSLEESFKQETEFWQETMNTKKIELLQKIELLINNAINELAISENYDLILYENAAFVSDEINITSKVIKRIQNNSL